MALVVAANNGEDYKREFVDILLYISASMNILLKYYYILKQEANIKDFLKELEEFIEISCIPYQFKCKQSIIFQYFQDLTKTTEPFYT